jgi:hypothetical protein
MLPSPMCRTSKSKKLPLLMVLCRCDVASISVLERGLRLSRSREWSRQSSAYLDQAALIYVMLFKRAIVSGWVRCKVWRFN